MKFSADALVSESTRSHTARFAASPAHASCSVMCLAHHRRGSCGNLPCSAYKLLAHATLWPLTTANHRGSECLPRRPLQCPSEACSRLSGCRGASHQSQLHSATLFTIVGDWRQSHLSASSSNVQCSKPNHVDAACNSIVSLATGAMPISHGSSSASRSRQPNQVARSRPLQ